MLHIILKVKDRQLGDDILFYKASYLSCGKVKKVCYIKILSKSTLNGKNNNTKRWQEYYFSIIFR